MYDKGEVQDIIMSSKRFGIFAETTTTEITFEYWKQNFNWHSNIPDSVPLRLFHQNRIADSNKIWLSVFPNDCYLVLLHLLFAMLKK